jgi:transposase
MREFIAMHERIWLEVRECIKKLEAQIDDALEPFRDAAELLQTVPGVGPVTAAAFVAAIGDPHRFPTSAHVASYIGLVPSTYDSGESKRGGRITKEGNGALRSCLCECAHQARRESNPLNPYYRRILAQKGYKRAVVAVAHRLARILYQIWKKKEAFDVNKLNVVRETIVHKRTTHYQLAKA